MWTSKKVILVALLVVVIAAGTAVVAFAQTGSNATTDQSQTPESQQTALLAKVATIYQENTGVALDTTALKEAFAQAQEEMKTESQASYLKSLVDEGKITQAEADEYTQWMQSKPDGLSGIQLPGMDFGGGMRGGMGGPGHDMTPPSTQ